MTSSMTAFSSRAGALGPATWRWEMRGVNARGLDMRLRLPEGIEGLEVALRKALTSALTRGNITVNLRLHKDDQAATLTVDTAQLDAILSALDTVQDRAFEMGVTLGQPTAADVLSQRGVMVPNQIDSQEDAIAAELMKDIAPLVADFVTMRAAEGKALESVVLGQLDQIEACVASATQIVEERADHVQSDMKAAMQRVLSDVAELDDQRLAQELALIAVKADITEELDRLRSHVKAARDLIATKQPIGRKLDFLAQEFNREANTLCAKSQYAPLTTIGLDLKAVIDQMREQIQNIE